MGGGGKERERRRGRTLKRRHHSAMLTIFIQTMFTKEKPWKPQNLLSVTRVCSQDTSKPLTRGSEKEREKNNVPIVHVNECID